MATTITLALVGCGGMGRRHVFGLRKFLEVAGGDDVRFELTAVIDRDRSRAIRLADEAEALLGRRPADFGSLDEALRAEAAECVDICTGSETHHAIGVEALVAGAHLFVEKPLAVTIRGATALIEAADRAGRVLSVAENVRREPVNRLAKHLIESGAIGEVRFVSDFVFTGGHAILLTPWRHRKVTGGPLLDVGVHNADVIEYLAGPVREVTGKIRLDEPVRYRAESPVRSAAFYETWEDELPEEVEADAEDVGLALLEFESGAIGQWTIHHAAHGAARSGRTIRGRRGAIELPPDRSGGAPVLTLDDGRRIAGREIADYLADFRLDPFEARVWGDARPGQTPGDFAEIDRALLAIELHDLGKAIREFQTPEVDGRGGRRSMALVYGMVESSTERRPVLVGDVERGLHAKYQSSIERELSDAPRT